MRTVAVLLLYAAVAFRGFVVFADEAARLPPVLSLLAAYGVLLLIETRATRRKPERHPPPGHLAWWLLAYLAVQLALVLRLLVVSTYEDFFASLLIPLSLDAVTFLGARRGFACIGVFALTLILTMLSSDVGRLFGLAMGVLNGGVCFLVGGYAFQMRRTAAARAETRSRFSELQVAHRQLQAYAGQATSLAIEQERNRLARELHDSVTQTVFSMNLAAQSARLLLDKDTVRAADQLLRIDELAASALREIQSLVTQLRPRTVGEEGLPAALRRLAAERDARDGLQVAVEVAGDGALTEAEATGLYAIAQEALTNVTKHSGVRRATIYLTLQPAGSRLEIADDGAGFDVQPGAVQPGHLGLAAMAERACEIGWRLSVTARPGRGTRVQVTPDSRGSKQQSVPEGAT